MATPTANASAKPQSGQAQMPFTPTATSPSAHPHSGNKSIRSPVSHMKRSRADTLRGMEQSASQQGTPRPGQPGSSPSFLGTPGPGLGISINTPNGGMATSTPGGAAMQRVGSNSFGLSSLGLDASLLHADREAFAKGKIAMILRMLENHWGQVSRVGVERLARRVKLECLWESGENEERGILAIAGDGNGFFLQITFVNHAVEDVQLNFPAIEGSGRSKDPEEEKMGSTILKRDLKGWDDEQDRGFYVDLIKFAHNMQYLATIDRLSKSGIRCFEAIDGVQKSLKEVEDWWKKRPGIENDLDVLNKGAGWSRMHGNGKIGARLDYWLHRWQYKEETKLPEYLAPGMALDPDIYGLRISVATLEPGNFVVPVRNTTDWFDFLDALPIEESEGIVSAFPPLQLQRKEPEPTYLPSTENQPDENGTLMVGMLPNIAFRAILDPPLLISYAAGSSLPEQANELATSYASNAYPKLVADSLPEQQSLFFAKVKKMRNDVTETTVRFKLSNLHELPAMVVQELPFSHPHELLTMLPILRQWAWLHALLTQSMGEPRLQPGESDGTAAPDGESVNPGSSRKKGKKKEMTAKEVRAILKAGGTWAPPTDTGDSDDEEQEEKSRTAETVDIFFEMPELFSPAGAISGLQNQIVLRLVIPRLDVDDSIMLQFTLSPGPVLLPSGFSAEDDFARRLAKVLLGTADLPLLVLWARENATKYMKPRKQTEEEVDEEMEDQ